MQAVDWSVLLHTIRAGRCVLMLGPDVDADPQAGQDPRVARELAHELASEVADERLDRDDAYLVAQMWLWSRNAGEDALRIRACRHYAARKAASSRLHDLLATLPFPVILTSTFDHLMEQSLRKVAKTPTCAHHGYRRKEPQALVPRWGAATPLLYRLTGSVADPDSMVLTETQLFEFLMGIVKGDHALPTNLKSHLQRKDVAFLFIGFGCARWHLRLLLHSFEREQPSEVSLALEGLGAKPIPSDAVLFLGRDPDTRLRFLDDDPLRFAEALAAAHAESEPTETWIDVTNGGDPAAGAPRVFICHASEDAATAQELMLALRQRGIDAWLDKHALVPGRDWDAEIRKQINKQADMVAVICSASLAAKWDVGGSYVCRELALARERARAYPHGSFLVPILLDDSARLDELEWAHDIDWRRPGAADRLAAVAFGEMKRRVQARG